MTLHLPKNFRWTCQHSGVCETAFLNIPVDDESQARLLNLDLRAMPEAFTRIQNPAEALAPPPEPGRDPSLNLNYNKCVFRCRDGLCEVHKIYGARAKPQVCQDFPFRFRDTPSGTYVGVSFVCPTVRRNFGAPFEDQRDDLADLATRAYGRRELGQDIRINRYLTLDWAGYLAFESAAVELLSDTGRPLHHRLIALGLLPRFIEKFDRELHGDPPPVEEERTLSTSQLQAMLSASARTGHRDLFRVASRPGKSGLARRAFLGMVTAISSSAWRKRSRLATLAGILAQYTRHAIGAGTIVLQPIDTPVPYAMLRRAALPENAESVELMQRYLVHCLERKDLLDRENLNRGINLLLLNAALLPWYAAAHASAGKRTAPSHADFSEAVGEVERMFGFHSRFYARVLGTNPIFDDLVQSFISRREYPFLMFASLER